jgi:hypothetical protein
VLWGGLFAWSISRARIFVASVGHGSCTVLPVPGSIPTGTSRHTASVRRAAVHTWMVGARQDHKCAALSALPTQTVP